MNCPLCIDETLHPTRRSGIEIDVCPRCRGIWLDRGELEKLAAPVAPSPSSARLPSDLEPPGGSGGKKPSKKKSKKKTLADRLGDVLEEVLDF